jgi:murein DD-endopeptidase MepM/ murein hydrolase activator NlpD
VQETSTTKRIAIALMGALVAGLFAGPVGASDTEDKLDRARAQLAKVEREAQAATSEYEAARGRYIKTQDEIEATRGRLRKVEKRVDRLQLRLGQRARDAYTMGGAGMLDVLFVSDSLSDFSDRVVFLDRIAQADEDLILRADVLGEELNRYRADLGNLLKRQKGLLKVLDEKRNAIYDKLQEAEALKQKLLTKLEREQAAARAIAAASRSIGSTGVVAGSALQACPAPGTSYVDSWGAPRSGGRTHQGVDMMGSTGTPVYAAQAGSVAHSSSDLGGIQAYVYGKSGDTTFYAHLSRYAGGPRSVSAGEQIGYIGDTGNASGTPHLHFEYHPGGGGAVNPYPYVRAVC